jgi:cytochrome c oxidase subunit 1
MSITAEGVAALTATSKSQAAIAETQGNKLGIWNMWVAFLSLLLGLPMGLFQVLERSGIVHSIASPSVYYTSASTHGVLLAYVLTTFFAMGFGYHSMAQSLKQPLWSPTFSWAGFWIAIIGVVLAASILLTGQASVFYTFYPPEMAAPLFYIGAVLLVVGSWFWVADMIIGMTRWKRANPGKPVPLIMFVFTMTALLWIWTSMGVALEALFQLVPFSLGISSTIDPGLSRTLFSWTLHAIVYFWLMPAYIVMYTILPKEAGGRLFSDEMARVAFVMLFIFSVPIGFHHLYMDPEQAAGWKLLHMFGTFMVAIPTFLTGFTVIASMEIAGRLRGGKGLFGWIGALDWGNPVALAGMLSLLMLTVGGFGGLINASYAMNSMIHDTQWVTGHFHLIFGGTTVIMYLAAAYWLWPKITGRELYSRKLAVVQLWIYSIGMVILTLPWHVLGLEYQPRRVSQSGFYSLFPQYAQMWDPLEIIMVFGGTLIVIAGLMFVYNLVMTQMNKISALNTKVEYAVAIHEPLRLPNILNSLSFWNWAMLAYMIVSYGYPILQFFFIGTPGVVKWGLN